MRAGASVVALARQRDACTQTARTDDVLELQTGDGKGREGCMCEVGCVGCDVFTNPRAQVGLVHPGLLHSALRAVRKRLNTDTAQVIFIKGAWQRERLPSR